MSIDKVTDVSAWMQKRRRDLMNLTPEARTYKRTRGRARTPEEKKALVLRICWKASTKTATSFRRLPSGHRIFTRNARIR